MEYFTYLKFSLKKTTFSNSEQKARKQATLGSFLRFCDFAS